MGNGELKNDYRDQLAKEAEREDPIKAETERVGEAEMMRRDTFVTMRHLQVQKQMAELDVIHNQGDAEIFAAFINELDALPVSEARAGEMTFMAQQVEKTLKALEQNVFIRSSEVLLQALASTLGGGTGTPPDPDDDLTAPELSEDDDLDEDDPNEEI